MGVSRPDDGAFIWLAVACAAEGAEPCALAWGEVDLDRVSTFSEPRWT